MKQINWDIVPESEQGRSISDHDCERSYSSPRQAGDQLVARFNGCEIRLVTIEQVDQDIRASVLGPHRSDADLPDEISVGDEVTLKRSQIAFKILGPF